PRFPFDKFTEADRTLGTQMKATGEVMAIERSFEGALHKAIRSLELNLYSLHFPGMDQKNIQELLDLIEIPNDLRLFAIAEAFKRKISTETIMELTKIDYWFLQKIKRIIDYEQVLVAYQLATIPVDVLKKAKQLNMSDHRIAELLGTTPKELREKYKVNGMQPVYKLVDTCAGEFDAVTPYYYSTWHGHDEVLTTANKKKILVLGSGPIRIGQGVEFDYCSVHATLALKKIGYEAVVMNNNPETVSTDYSVADRLYFDPLALEDVLAVIEKEQVAGVLIQFGGQTAINLANDLKDEGVHILGTLPEHIDQMEDREQFYNFLNELRIPHIAGRIVHELDELPSLVHELGFPVLIRPSYVIGGQSMFICYSEKELYQYTSRIQQDTNDRCWPLLIDQYLPGLECEVDVVSDGKEVVIPGIVEHIEKAGIHSGDSIGVFPPVTLSDKTKEAIVEIVQKISSNLPVIGMMNIQFVIHQDTIYVLEVNPRSSRTVPIMSKVTGVPMVEWAVRSQLGIPLTEITDEVNLMKEPEYYTIKAPVFSASKLKGVDHVLGPEMKSTGEIIGIGYDKKEALKKTMIRTHHLEELTKPLQLFVSISDRLKQESLPIIREFSDRGAIITATEGTAKVIEENGMVTKRIVKSKKDILNHWQDNPPHIVLNIPNQGREKEKIGFLIRELSVRFQVPYFTSLETLNVFAGGLNQALHEKEILSLQEYLSESFRPEKIITK
ncbi:MAG: carbamoyl phosphate synthase large subunit, partial [Oceanobacillus sp.]|nr:carbamoyl phosphate synthase large subunit [Oceanobacillus sp.]